MQIAALYICRNSIPYIFGDDHDEITINLGGRNLYTVEEGEIVRYEPNPLYLEGIFNDGVSLLSCIVGSNGGGKSTLLKLLTSDEITGYVIEEGDGRNYMTSTLKSIHRIYYTPYLTNYTFGTTGENGKDLSKITMIRTDNHGDSSRLDDFFAAHFSENVKRWIKFNHFYRQQKNLKVTLPSFDNITIHIQRFDFNYFKQDSFHDTSYQLRPVLKILIEKIHHEKDDEEKKALADWNGDVTNVDKLTFPIKFKYALYESVLGKLVSVFERQGNRYLEEGVVPENFVEILSVLDIRECMIWFFKNCGVQNGDIYIFKNHLAVIELIDYIVSLQSVSRLTDSWLEMMVNEQEAVHIIDLYDNFNEGFNNAWFKFDSKPLLSFRPHIVVSSGEQSFLDLFSTLYYHASNMRAGIEVDFHSFEPFEYLDDKVLLLLDEGDNAFHPRWRKSYVRYLRNLLPVIFKGYNLQVIITSHDPLTLSDIPRNNAVFLEKLGDRTVIKMSDNTNTFGANVADLLKESFFIGDGQTGDFFASVIDEVIKEIRSKHLSPGRINDIQRTIRSIDEPVIKFKLAQMLGDTMGDSQFEKRLIDMEIESLERRRREL